MTVLVEYRVVTCLWQVLFVLTGKKLDAESYLLCSPFLFNVDGKEVSQNERSEGQGILRQSVVAVLNDETRLYVCDNGFICDALL